MTIKLYSDICQRQFLFREANNFPRLERGGNPILTILQWFIFRFDKIYGLKIIN